MATIQEKQDLINKKDWDGLSKTDIYSDFDFSHNEWKEYSLNKEFFLEFYFKEYFWKLLVNKSSYYDDDLLYNGFRAISKLDFSVNDYVKVFKAFKAIEHTGTRSDYFRSLSNPIRLGLENSPATENFQLAHLESDILNDPFFRIHTLDIEKVSSLSSFDAFMQSIDKAQISVFKNQDKIYDRFFNNKEECLDHLIDLPIKKLDFSSVFRNLTKDEIIELIDYFKKKYNNHDKEEKVLRDLYSWFFKTKTKMSDEMLDFVRDNFKDIYQKFLVSMDYDQIEKRAKSFTHFELCLNTDLPLDKVVEIGNSYQRKLVDISSARFFTEEEIIAHPNFFHPSNIKISKSLYVSKETFRLLNKTWGLRQRYDELLTDFSSIIRSVHTRDLTTKVFKYLAQKTNTPNNELVDFLSKNITSNMYFTDLGNLIKFLMKFK